MGAKKGKPKSELHKQRMSEAHNKKFLEGNWVLSEKVTCPHCKKTMDIGNFRKWHGDKCRYKWIASSPNLKKRR